MLKKNWVVNIKPVGSGQTVLKYLAPYVHRVAISLAAIVGDRQQLQLTNAGAAMRNRLLTIPGWNMPLPSQ